jgi:glycolate dehydrogenase FAD-binding subunit
MTSERTVVPPALTAACAVAADGDVLVASPASTPEASALLRAAAAAGLTVAPRGAGLGWVRAPADLVVDTRRMDRVVEHAAGDLVATVQAGALMGSVAVILSAAGQRLALDVPPDVTVGGMIATGLAGPLRFRYGSPRDLLIGITVVRPDGVVAHSGGKVVKNVAGYDLGKLFAGSYGTLGLVTEATFRLHPIPQAVAYLTVPAGDAAAAVIAAANSPLQPSAVELGPDGTAGVLLEGTPAGVAARAEELASVLGGAEVAGAPPSWWGSLPAPPGAAASPPGFTVVRVTFWLARLREVLAAVAASGVPCSVSGPAGAGLLYLCASPDTDLSGLLGALRGLLAGRGGVRVLTEPPGPGGALMRAVRDQFDPAHRMGGLCRIVTSSGAWRRTACTAGSACRPARHISCGARRRTRRAAGSTWSPSSSTAPR